jgi:membrane protein DedA with SNARE-associated domain
MVLVSPYIEHFTYLGLLVILLLCGMGLPLSEDVVLLAAGYLVHHGVTRYGPTLGVSLVGVVGGDLSLFLLGRRFGQGVLRYLVLTRPGSQRRIERLKAFMARHGHRAILYARFFVGARALVYISAGTLGVAVGRFVAFDVLGAVFSVPIMVSAGYLFGDQIETVIKLLGGVERVIFLLVVLSAAIAVARLVASARQERQAASSH